MPKLSKFQPLSPSLCGHQALLLSILLFTGDHLSTSIIWPNSLPLVSLTNLFSTLPWHTLRHKCSHHSLLRKLWQSPSQLLPPQEVQCPSIPDPTSTPVPILTPLTTPDSLPSYKVQLPPPDICFFSPTAACFWFSLKQTANVFSVTTILSYHPNQEQTIFITVSISFYTVPA